VPSHSGGAGAAPFRYLDGKSELRHNIARFAHWFRPDFKRFVGKVERLPVDSALAAGAGRVAAAVEHRGHEGRLDQPGGAQLTQVAARKAYNFLKAGAKISNRYRPVGHVPSNADLFAYADHVCFDRALPADLGKLPYTTEVKATRWAASKVHGLARSGEGPATSSVSAAR
jgi:hypothetical protein